MNEEASTEVDEEVNEVEQLYSYPSFIKIEPDDSILVDGQVNADIKSPIEFTKVFVLPYAKIDPVVNLNKDVQGEYKELFEEITEGVVEVTDTQSIEADISETMHHDHNYEDGTIKLKDNTCYSYLLEAPSKNSCDICSKSFNTPATLKRHMRTHTGERPFQCQICEKYFSQQSNLWKHVRIHTGERPFECPQCKKKFSQRANLKKHLVIHTGERPFVCYFCYRAFTQQANLSKHMRLHTGEKPYSCSYCDKRFTQRSNLQKHEHLHEGIKPYTCEICFQAFTQQSNLKKHVMMHQNIRKFVCGVCCKSYVQKVSLLKHRERCSLERNENSNIKYINNLEDYMDNGHLLTEYENFEENSTEQQDTEDDLQEVSYDDSQISESTELLDASGSQVLAVSGLDLNGSRVIEIQVDDKLNSEDMIQFVVTTLDEDSTEILTEEIHE